jgi:hypothetical protein
LRRILREKDDIHSVIRIVDAVTLNPVEGGFPPGVTLELPLEFFVMFVQGDTSGELEFGLRLITPSGISESGGSWKAPLGGPPESAHAFITKALRLKWEAEGLYWYELLADGVPVTRVPLRVTIAQPTAGGEAPAPDPGRTTTPPTQNP